MDEWGCVDVDDVVLVCSELVTMSVAQTGAPPQVALSRAPGTLRIEVRDGCGVMPEDSSSACIVRIVELVAVRWGWAPLDHGKSVWCELAL